MKKATIILAWLLCVCLLAGCSGTPAATEGPGTSSAPSQETEPRDILYTFSVRTADGRIPAELEYYVYKNAQLVGVETFGQRLGESGTVSFTASSDGDYHLVLRGAGKMEWMAEGFLLEESYPLGQNTEIIIDSAVVTDKDPFDLTDIHGGKRNYYVLGDMMRDFSVTDTDGNTYTVSQLLETKKCVVLNFWNITCVPCRMEFPHLQKAYEEYADQIALLAISPDPKDTDDMIRTYRENMGLTFPMGKCDNRWVDVMARLGNPTTVIIDRYGRICVLETGGMPEGVFEAVFEHFVAEDYKQILIDDMETFAAEKAQA